MNEKKKIKLKNVLKLINAYLGLSLSQQSDFSLEILKLRMARM